MNFSEFKEKLETLNFSQNYIFEGNEAFLKTSLNYLVKQVLNPNDDFKVQKEIEEKTHPDLLIIEEERNNISIEKIRNMIDYVQKRPLISNYKLVIIKDGQCLRKESANALLKTLEESFSYTIIAIFTDSRYKLLDTIKSRCIFVSSNNLDFKIDFNLYEKLLDIVDISLDKDFYCIYNLENINYLLSLKDDKDFLKVFFEIFKEFYIFLETKNENIDKKLLTIFKKHSNFKKEKVDDILKVIQRVSENLNNNVNFRLSLEEIFITILN